MLQNDLYKRLREQNWLYFNSRDPNPSQTVHRFRLHVHRSLETMSLIAQKLPDEKQESMFTEERVSRLVSKVLKVDTDSILSGPIIGINKLDSRRVQISSNIVEKALEFCISQFKILFPESESLLEPTIKQLRQTIRICGDIANKVELKELRSLAKQNKQEYLFNWDKVTTTDEGKLNYFLFEETNLTFGITGLKKSGKSLSGKIEDDGRLYYTFRITVIDGGGVKPTASFVLKDADSKKLFTKNLFVQKRNTTYYIFNKK